MAKQSCFKEAALQAQEAAAAEEEGETQAMLFVMLQDQHTKQIAKIEAANIANMDAMMERVNAIMTANSGKPMHQPDKENNPPGGNLNLPTGGSKRVKKPRRKRHYVPTARRLFSTSRNCATNWKRIRQHVILGGNPYSQRPQLPDRDQGQQ